MQIVHKINNSSLYQVLAFYYVSWALAMPKLQHLGLDFVNEFEISD